MPADEPQVELRPRSAYEAADLGLTMLRVWWRPLAATWCALVLPFAAITMLALRESPWIAVLVLWWLRPLFARIPLHVLSRMTFGQPTGVAETLRSLPQLARSGLLGSLTFLRFSPARTLTQPVLQLEGLRGSARRARCAVLTGRDLGAAMATMTVAAHITGVIAFGVYGGVSVLVPEEVSWDFSSLFTPFFDDVDMGWLGLMLPAIYFFALSIVEPLLVSAGFAMYLNRRVFLEGWDIEIALRRLSERARRGSVSRVAALFLVGVIGSSFAAPGVGRAEAFAASECVSGEPESANSCADAILATGEFGGMKEIDWWALKDFEFEEDGDEEESEGAGWLGRAMAQLFETALWLLVAIALIVLASAIARNFAVARRARSVDRPAPTRLFGLDLKPDSLPEDLVGAARAAWQRGEFVEAMSLLYRGALIHLIDVRGVRIPESATEYECVALVSADAAATNLETAAVFKDLTQAWVGTRYATAPPTNSAFDALCSAFHRAFPVPTAAPNDPEGEAEREAKPE